MPLEHSTHFPINISVHQKFMPIKKITVKKSSAQKQKNEILVAATMSAGKSTLINALIGRELLHSANEATTACLTSIEHSPRRKKFQGTRHFESGTEVLNNLSAKEIQTWNSNPKTKYIKISGKFNTHPPPKSGLIFHDTPGPNNSQDGSHARILQEAIRTVPFKTLCYVLNASQLGTKDDQALLLQLHDLIPNISQRQIIFALNKIDLLDPERGESFKTCVNNARSYLWSVGFKQPIIVPTMATAAIHARKALSTATLTRMQSSKLCQSLNEIEHIGQDLLHASHIPDSIRKQISDELNALKISQKTEPQESHALKELITYSGIRTIETLINHQHRITSKK
jgi:GTPase Era involved in 16S rRNA processing